VLAANIVTYAQDSQMSLADIHSRAAILRAIAEYDALGQAAFLATYGFGPARSYFLVHEGRSYDSKAIVGAAHGYEYPQLGPLGAHDFSGGEATVARKLEALGFEVRREGITHPTDAQIAQERAARMAQWTQLQAQGRPCGVLSAEMLRRLDAVIDYARGALPRLGLTEKAAESPAPSGRG
jgi:hypothetical protein